MKLGERAFEIVLARNQEESIWFERHGSSPITETPSHWPEPYRALVEQRIALIETNRDIGLIERPEYKRRWNLPLGGDGIRCIKELASGPYGSQCRLEGLFTCFMRQLRDALREISIGGQCADLQR